MLQHRQALRGDLAYLRPDLRRIEDLLDDELRSKALLAPITDTGEPLLRDLTHRVRAFRNVFKTWEELHIDPNDGQLRHVPHGPTM